MDANTLPIIAIVVSAISIIVSGILTYMQLQLQKRVTNDESTSESRRFFAEMWDKMKVVNHIDISNPASAVVRTNLNVMELMALCWNANIVDKKMMTLAFAKEYCSLYDELHQVNIKIKDLDRNGRELLADVPAISVLYDAFKKELLKQGQM